MPAQAHTITFWVDEEGFHYRDQGNQDARRKHVKKADSVAWRSRGKQDFVILFAGPWPFADPPRIIDGTGGETKPLEVTLTPAPGKPIECKYTVTLKSGLSNDPEIIIDPNGGD